MRPSLIEESTPLATDLIRSSPVGVAIDILSDQWSWLVLRSLFLGFSRFGDLRRNTGAARGTLVSRLQDLLKNDVVRKHQYDDAPARFEYRLTEIGLALYPIALSMWSWEKKWTTPQADLPSELSHRPCGKSIFPIVIRCRSCRKEIAPKDVFYSVGTRSGHHALPTSPNKKRRRRHTRFLDSNKTPTFHIVDIIGDRWTPLVLAAIWFQQYRHDDIASAIGIATNILSDRLRSLVAQGVLEKRVYLRQPPRHEYHMSDKGWDLYNIAILMHDWANNWLKGGQTPSLQLRHVCGAQLQCVTTCGGCEEILLPRDVHFSY